MGSNNTALNMELPVLAPFALKNIPSAYRTVTAAGAAIGLKIGNNNMGL